jgi:hypothetical protein
MIIERPLRVMGITRNLLNQFAVCFKDFRVGAGQVQAVRMISQCFVAHPACHRAPVLVLHQEPNTVLL